MAEEELESRGYTQDNLWSSQYFIREARMDGRKDREVEATTPASHTTRQTPIPRERVVETMASTCLCTSTGYERGSGALFGSSGPSFR